MGSKREKPEEERPRPRLRLDEIARSGRMRVHDQAGVDAEQKHKQPTSKKGLMKSLGKRAGKLKRKKDETDDEIRKLLESDDFGAPRSKIRFSPVKKSGEDDAKDISSLWSEQERIRKDEEKLEQSYKQAKEQAKKLKKQLLKNQIGDGVATSLADKTSGLTATLSDVPLKVSSILRRKKASKTHLDDRAGTPRFSRLKKRTKRGSSGAHRSIITKKRVIAGTACLVIIGGVFRIISANQEEPNTSTLGAQAQVKTGQLPEEKPPFEILYPAGKTSVSIKTVRVSPGSNAPAYAYLDTLGTAQLKITQQELPQKFKEGVDAELEKLAKDFQATNIIQVDDRKIYHGYNEKTHVQSLVFIKKERLVFIAASEKLSDDVWASYYLGLQ